MADPLCIKCQEEITTEKLSLSCAECGYSYHCGSCAGVSEATLKTKGELYRKTWKCATCRTVKLKGGACSKQKQEDDMSAMLANMNRKLDDLLTLKETVGGIEASIQLMSDKYDEILSHIAKQDHEIKDLKKRVDAIEESEKQSEIGQLKQEINDLEWRSRRCNLEFHGVPKTEGENLLSKVNELARVLDVPELTIHEVAAVHRLPSRPEKIPGIIVRFTSQATRDVWLDKKAKLRTTGANIYINENLTKFNRELLVKMKEWARQKGFSYVWHRNGKLFARRKDGERAVIIKNEDDLLKMN